jgi:hypothetical protein
MKDVRKCPPMPSSKVKEIPGFSLPGEGIDIREREKPT